MSATVDAGHVDTHARAVPDADNLVVAEIHRRQVSLREHSRCTHALEISAVEVDALGNVDRPRARSSKLREVAPHTKFLTDIAGERADIRSCRASNPHIDIDR